MALNQQHIENMISGLKNMAVRLSLHRATLSQQTVKVAEQIDAVFEVQTEALNQRRQWLLHQLALIEADKMDSINRKQEVVECSLADVQKLLSDPSKYNPSHIKESFEGIHNLMSEDTRPFIAFRSDPALLREIISQYGVILKQYGGHFADPTRPSISLPSVVEEEDDEDGVAFSKRDEVTKNDETNILHVTTFPVNSSIVRAWLMSENDSTNGLDMGVSTPKSDCDSFVKVESIDNEESKEMKDNNIKKIWLNKEKDSTNSSDYSDMLKPFGIIKNQSNSLWLSELSSVDDDKEVDHYELLQKACLVGNCKKFEDCCQKENCCNKLLDPARPSWNKWLLENNVFKSEFINPQVLLKNTFCNQFKNILKSDNKKWLIEQKIDLKRQNERIRRKESEIFTSSLDNQLSKQLIFNESLEKWISLASDLEFKDDKNGMAESLNKYVQKMSLDEWDGLMHNESERMQKWLMDRQP